MIMNLVFPGTPPARGYRINDGGFGVRYMIPLTVNVVRGICSFKPRFIKTQAGFCINFTP